MADVFISYSKADDARVPPMARALGAAGYRVWWNRDQRAGEAWDAVIEREMRGAGCVLFVWSGAALTSDWVKGEARIGKDRGALVAVSLDGTEPPFGFAFVQGLCVRAGQGPQHDVAVPAFAMGKYEVTLAQWRACAREGFCRHLAGARPGRGAFPVMGVSWRDVTGEGGGWWRDSSSGSASGSAGRRAARAGSRSRLFWGEVEALTQACQFANGSGRSSAKADPGQKHSAYTDGHAGPAPISPFAPNAFGLHDMPGNAPEWVRDCWHGSYEGAPANARPWLGDPATPCPRAVIKGSGFFGTPESLRSAFQNKWNTENRLVRTGSRVAVGGN